MADDIKSSLNDAKAADALNAQANKTLQNTNSTLIANNKALLANSKNVDKLGNSFKNAARQARPFTKETEVIGKIMKKNEQTFKTATDQIVNFSLKGKKAALGFSLEMREMASETLKLSKATADQSKIVGSLMQKYSGFNDELTEVKKKILGVNDAFKKGSIDRIEAEKQTKDLREEQNRLENSMATLSSNIEIQATSLRSLTKEMLDQHNSSVNRVRDMRAEDRELKRMKGGLSAWGAELEEVMDSKLFKWIDSKAYLAFLANAGRLVNEAVKQTGAMYKNNHDLAIQFGTDAQMSLMQAGKEAIKTQMAITKTAASLGMQEEQIAAIADKIRSTNKLGQLFATNQVDAEANVRSLTTAVASFSRTTGVDADSAVEMLDRRMKTMGMTAAQAADDMGSMSIILGQMQAGTKGSAIGMEEMTKMIEQAATSSDSYVVDTRLMTTAMRAASEEAFNLSKNQKLAKAAAETTGKFVGGKTGVDWIDTLTSFGLAHLDTKSLMKNLTGGQKKLVEQIQADAAKYGYSDLTLGKMLLEAVGGSDAAVKERTKQIETLIGKKGNRNKNAPLLLVQAGIAKDELAANELIKQIDTRQDVTDRAMKDGIDDVLTETDKMQDRAKDYNKAMEKMDQAGKIAFLKKKGLTTNEAKEALKIQDNKVLTDEGHWSEMTKFLSEKLNPHKKSESVMKQLEQLKQQNKTLDEQKEFLRQQYELDKNDEGANKRIEDVLNSSGDDTQVALEGLQQTTSEAAKEQQKNAIDNASKFAQGFASPFISKLLDMAPWLKNPAVQAAANAGIGAVMGTVGTSAMTALAMKVMSVFKGGKGGGGAGGGEGGGGGSGRSLGSKIKDKIWGGSGKAAESVEKVIEGASKAEGSVLSTALETAEKTVAKSKGSLAKRLIGGTLAAGGIVAAGMMLGGGNAKAAEGEDNGQGLQPEPPKKERTGSGALSALGNVETGAVVGQVGLGALGKFGGVAAAKSGSKMLGKAVPFLGIALGAMSTLGQIKDMWDKSQSGQQVGPGDWARLGVEAGTMIPYVGIGLAAGGAYMDATGGYDKMNGTSLPPGGNVNAQMTAGQMPATQQANPPGTAGGRPTLNAATGNAQKEVQIMIDAATYSPDTDIASAKVIGIGSVYAKIALANANSRK